MNSEKVKEIKKALECCINDCSGNSCPYDKYEKGLKCIDDLQKDALTLINELESENAYKQEHIEMWFRKNEEKKDRIAELEKENALIRNSVAMRDYKTLEEISNDKLKQFAERLKESASQNYVSQNGVRISDITYSISDGTINKILKEFINVDK